MDYKKEFIELLKTTNRQGIDDLVTELEDMGFFKAPASTKFHLNEEEQCKMQCLFNSENLIISKYHLDNEVNRITHEI